MKKRIEIRELGDPIVIVQKDPGNGALGCLDERTGEIRIDPKAAEEGKHILVLHELLHLVDAQMVAAGIRKRRLPEGWIESAAPNLLAVLVCAGFWRGLSKRDLLRFMAEHMEGP